MMCFRDMTFCDSDCTSVMCFRRFTQKTQDEANSWWGGDDAPIAFSDFSSECDGYVPPEATKNA